MASAAIHGLLGTLWFNLAGNGTNEMLQKGTILELVTIEVLSEKVATPPRPASIRASNPPVKQTEQIALEESDVTHTEMAAMSLPANQATEPSEPEPAITTTTASGQAAMEKTESSSETGNATNSLVRSHLESFKFYPASARRRGIEGHVDVAFVLTQNGAADQISVLHGSGYSMLDRAAIQTVSRAQPFPVDDGTYRFRLKFKRL
ncbi:MAG: energy transducer TonB [Mariprofundaceae bacterium]|nr:energy transducer TonB [Mariprofundaceae bacterium]